MKTIVVKFGGSSLADAEHIRKAAAIIKADPARRIAVVSAPGKRTGSDTKVTDMLYQCFDLAYAGKDHTPVLDQIRQRFADIIEGLGIEFDLDKEITKIDTQLRENPQKHYMASRGEYLNAKIIAAFLGFRFLDTKKLIHFTSYGKLNETSTAADLGAALSGDECIVLPGFYGSLEDGSIHTFSRGGSDVTGSLAAAAAGADIYENWTDVSGVLFTDPRIVKDARPIDYITYRELRELSYMGASVLHEDAIFPVRKCGIPINIRNTNAPEDAGTMIVAEAPENAEKRVVTGLAGKKGFTSVHVEKSMMNSEVGFGVKLLDIFQKNDVPFEHCPTGIDTMSVIVNSAEFREKKDVVLQQIRQILQPEFVSIDTDLALIAIVGRGMVYTKGTAARVFSCLAACGVNIRMIDQGSSEMNIIIGIDGEDYNAALNALSAEFA